MGYVRWVCTKCGSVVVTEGRRPGPNDGLKSCVYYANKNRGTQPHRWVKDGAATQDEYANYQAANAALIKRERGCLLTMIIVGIILFILFVI